MSTAGSPATPKRRMRCGAWAGRRCRKLRQRSDSTASMHAHSGVPMTLKIAFSSCAESDQHRQQQNVTMQAAVMVSLP